jgi:deoxycytidylate deaminase
LRFKGIILEDQIVNLDIELIFGLVGPIGADLGLVEDVLTERLKAHGYSSHLIRITDLMLRLEADAEIVEDSYFEKCDSKIAYGNAVRKKFKKNNVLAALAVEEIRSIRSELNDGERSPADDNADKPVPKNAFIIRQLKRPEEVELLRQIYGRKFIQISAEMLKSKRIKSLTDKILRADHDKEESLAESCSRKLVERDENEIDQEYGQRLNEIFHKGDVFVGTNSKRQVDLTLHRFVDALFGRNDISPTKDEYGAYIAASAALRTVDMSRQVGAAIFTKEGEIISLGCNEVPKFGGGTYWDDDPAPHRDIDNGFEPNSNRKAKIAYNLIEKLYNQNLISTEKSLHDFFDEVLKNKEVKSAKVFDITEYGRMAHAEMSAILDASRLGRSTKNSTLFCTTFPCHNCAKHIVTAGISRVVYIEPYEKSQALSLHEDSISLNPEDSDKVIFEHFRGISPRRYRDIFEKGRRSFKSGEAKQWYHDRPVPMIEDKSENYVNEEVFALVSTFSKRP